MGGIMGYLKKITIFFMGFLLAWGIFGVDVKKAACQNNLSQNVNFTASGTNMYFLDRDESNVYIYNTQGKLTRIYQIKKLGENLVLK
jgi:hypothetical protein